VSSGRMEEVMSEDRSMDKIQILLAEHKSLRDEITAKNGQQYQFLMLAVAVIALLANLTRSDPLIFWPAVVVSLMLSALQFWTFVRDTWKAGERVREIELDINERAQEDLLIWENLWGGSVTGFYGLARPFPRSYLVGKSIQPRTFHGRPIS
jgi:hypothetical protein